MMEIYVSTSVTLSDVGVVGCAGTLKEEAGISPAVAADLLRKQACLIERNERADMNKVRQLSLANAHFAAVLNNGRAVGLLVAEDNLRRKGSSLGTRGACIEANLHPYGSKFSLDRHDMLYSDTWWSKAIGTCFLVDDKKVLTTRHSFVCDSGAQIALQTGTLRVVFGYQFTQNDRPCEVFCDKLDVFEIKAIKLPPPEKGDWIALELKHSATKSGRRTKLNVKADPPTANTPVYSLGHQMQTSLRYTKTDLPLSPSASGFDAFLDAYDGSSGAPVFSAQSHEVIGMVAASYQSKGLVRVDEVGERRFVSLLCLPEYSKATLCVHSAAFAGHY